jgi:hypothetical protein
MEDMNVDGGSIKMGHREIGCERLNWNHLAWG